MKANEMFRVSIFRLLAFSALCLVAVPALRTQAVAQSHGITGRAVAPQIVESHRRSFSGMVTVKLIEPDLRCRVYYTIDGSDPLASGLTYTGPFLVKRGTRIRTVAKWPGHLSSEVISHTFR